MRNIAMRSCPTLIIISACVQCICASLSPVESVTSPAPASTHHVGERLAIVWKAESTLRDRRIVIDISIDGKRTWTQVTPEAISNEDQKFEWTIPESLLVIDLTKAEWIPVSPVSDQAYLLLYEYDSDSEKTSAGPFSIQSTSALARPQRPKQFIESRVSSHTVTFRRLGTKSFCWSELLTVNGKTIMSLPLGGGSVRGQTVLLKK